MFYYLYEIKNLINNKIYVGVHKTTHIDDGYMGSGKVILRAIQKNGIENFIKTILETFENSEEMFAREKEVVTDEFLARPDTYNLRRGGSGGFDYLNKTGLNLTGKSYKSHRKAWDTFVNKNPDNLQDHRDRWSKIQPLGAIVRSLKYPDGTFLNRKHTDETKQKMRKSAVGKQQGDRNSQYGLMWITDGTESKKIKKDSPILAGWRKGRICPNLRL